MQSFLFLKCKVFYNEIKSTFRKNTGATKAFIPMTNLRYTFSQEIEAAQFSQHFSSKMLPPKNLAIIVHSKIRSL